MKVKIISADSEHTKHRIGQERNISFIGNRMIMEYVDDSGRSAVTSKIDYITVQTQNTTYELEVIDER